MKEGEGGRERCTMLGRCVMKKERDEGVQGDQIRSRGFQGRRRGVALSSGFGVSGATRTGILYTRTCTLVKYIVRLTKSVHDDVIKFSRGRGARNRVQHTKQCMNVFSVDIPLV